MDFFSVLPALYKALVFSGTDVLFDYVCCMCICFFLLGISKKDYPFPNGGRAGIDSVFMDRIRVDYIYKEACNAKIQIDVVLVLV